MPKVAQSHLDNYVFSLGDQFVPWMIKALKDNYVRIMRVHVSGDFYHLDYVRKWLDIVRQSRNQQFFAYTRSWREEPMLQELVKLSREDNFELWWSMDLETGQAPYVSGIRRAYMAIDDVDAKNAPPDCDLVFRDKPKTKMIKANGVAVCPVENGNKTQRKITCSTCGLCWRSRLPRWEDHTLSYVDNTRAIDAPTLSCS